MSAEEPRSALRTSQYDVYPEPSTKTPPTISRQELLAWITQGKTPGRDFVVVDLRRLDHTGGFIRGSINLPIESLHAALPALHMLFRNVSIKTVIWYCSQFSAHHQTLYAWQSLVGAKLIALIATSHSYGNRAAAWFGDYLKQQNDLEIQSLVLFEGILGQATAGGEYIQHIDEYMPEAQDPADAVNYTKH